MLESPFTFYRGAAVIMAADLGTTPNAGLRVQACGDAHLSNFGGFASPDRSLVFDINDFDETSAGPFEWDVKRLCASFEIAARSRELTSQEARSLTTCAVQAYREAMADFARRTNLEVWYARLDAQRVIDQFRSQASARDVKRFAEDHRQGADQRQHEGVHASSPSTSTATIASRPTPRSSSRCAT